MLWLFRQKQYSLLLHRRGTDYAIIKLLDTGDLILATCTGHSSVGPPEADARFECFLTSFSMYTVYVLINPAGVLYKGYTSDLDA